MKNTDFKRLYFGAASAEIEVARDPEKFLKTYYDRWNLAAAVRRQEFFLVIGPKGSGKSAVGEYVRLSLAKKYGNYAVFSKTLDLEQVAPGMNPLTAIRKKDISDQGGYLTDAAWRLFLALQIIDLLVRDQSCSLNSDPQFLKMIEELRRADLLGQDFPSIFKRIRENKTAIALKGLVTHERASKETGEVSLLNLGEALLDLICNARSDNHFLLCVDGLDRIISSNEGYWLTLAALLRVGDELFRRLLGTTIDVRLLIMCRSDVFRRIRFADADKIIADSSLYVDWGADRTTPADSPLWDYLAKKAGITPENLLSVFPESVTVGKRSDRPRPIPTVEYLLQATRSTPREITILMRRLQEEIPINGYPTAERIRAAVDTFASRDLLAVVTAEATGLLHEELQDGLAEILTNLPSAVLNIELLTQAAIDAGIGVELINELAQFLFMAGLIGNFDPKTGYVQFYHRRDTYKFKRNGLWLLNRSLMYAFNIPYVFPSPQQAP